MSNWYILGTYSDGYVDVVDSNGDVLTHITHELAERLIINHERAVQGLPNV